MHRVGVSHQAVKLGAGSREALQNGVKKCRLGVAVAVAAGTVRRLHLGNLLGAGNEAVERHNVAGRGVLGVLESRRVGDNAHDLLLQFFFGQEDVNDVSVGLGHFLAIGSGNRHHRLLNARLGKHKHFVARDAVKRLSDVAGDFEVLALVLAHRNQVRIVQQDIRGHQDRIIKESGVNVAEAV